MPCNADADMHRSAPAALHSSRFPKGGVPFPAPPNHRRNSRSECKGLADIAPQVPRDRTWPYPRRAPTAPLSRLILSLNSVNWVPLDKSEGVVKTEISWAVREHRFFAREG